MDSQWGLNVPMIQQSVPIVSFMAWAWNKVLKRLQLTSISDINRLWLDVKIKKSFQFGSRYGDKNLQATNVWCFSFTLISNSSGVANSHPSDIRPAMRAVRATSPTEFADCHIMNDEWQNFPRKKRPKVREKTQVRTNIVLSFLLRRSRISQV